MKKTPFITAVFILFCSHGMTAQTLTDLNQTDLLKKFYGEWHMVTKGDTVQSFEMLPNGSVVIQTSLRIIKGKKHIDNVSTFKYDPDDESFGITGQSMDSENVVWLGYFIDENTLRIEKLESESGKTLELRIFVLDNPATFSVSYYNVDGDMYRETKWTRITGKQVLSK